MKPVTPPHADHSLATCGVTAAACVANTLSSASAECEQQQRVLLRLREHVSCMPFLEIREVYSLAPLSVCRIILHIFHTPHCDDIVLNLYRIAVVIQAAVPRVCCGRTRQ